MKALQDIIQHIKYGPHMRTVNDGTIRYLKGNHFDEDFALQHTDQSYVQAEEADSKHWLIQNDVILAAKGFRNFVWKYEDTAGPCVASSLFYVIKLDTKMILPDYFVMVMNTAKIQYQLKNIGLGATIPAIPKKELLRIKIPVPPMEQQLKAIQIYQLLQKEIQLERAILEQKIRRRAGILNILSNETI